MKIYIPTVGREDKQKTAQALKRAGIHFKLIVPLRDFGKYKHWPYRTTSAKGIRATRQGILEHAHGKFIMMDDDLVFFTRSKDGKTFHPASSHEIRKMLREISKYLDTYAHGGVLEKFMSQTQPREVKFNSKYLHILAYNKDLFPQPHPEFLVEVAEDMQMNLSLLTMGKPNFVLTEWAADNVIYADGGCNSWRTHKVEYEATEKFAAMFPGLVKLVADDMEKLKKRWNKPAQPNLRTRVSWKDAIEIGLSKHPQRFPRD